MKLLRKWAAAYLLDAQRKPPHLQALNYTGIDDKGTRYYGFSTLADMPLDRTQRMFNAAMYMDARISPETLARLAGKINEVNMLLAQEQKPEQRRKYHAQIAAMCSELEERPNYISPESTFYEMAALTSIREDEDAEVFNAQIHAEKIVAFKRLAGLGQTFFFSNPIMKGAVSSLIGTEESWMATLQSWEMESQRLETRYRTILSETPSSATTTTSSK